MVVAIELSLPGGVMRLPNVRRLSVSVCPSQVCTEAGECLMFRARSLQASPAGCVIFFYVDKKRFSCST